MGLGGREMLGHMAGFVVVVLRAAERASGSPKCLLPEGAGRVGPAQLVMEYVGLVLCW